MRSCLMSWNWGKTPKPYVWVCNVLTYIGRVILFGTRIMIPNILRKRVLELAHEGHQLWRPGVDKDAELKC